MRGDADPCIYHKKVKGTKGDQVYSTLYVDDIKNYCNPSPEARAEFDKLNKKLDTDWKIKFGEKNAKESFLLSTNCHRHSSKWTTINMRTYIEDQMKKHLKKDLEDYPKSWSYNPCGKDIMKEYEHAMAKTEMLEQVENDEFGSICGGLQYAVSYRPDVAFGVGICARCRSFPTKGMKAAAERILVYLAHTRDLGINYVNNGPNSAKIWGRCDSDWYVRRSTTGHHINIAGGAVSAKSGKQHAIAMSSTEAELMGLADCALDLLYVRSVMSDLGYQYSNEDDVELETKDKEAHRLVNKAREMVHGPTEIGTDNTGAYDLCHRDYPAKNSRHVERKGFSKCVSSTMRAWLSSSTSRPRICLLTSLPRPRMTPPSNAIVRRL